MSNISGFNLDMTNLIWNIRHDPWISNHVDEYQARTSKYKYEGHEKSNIDISSIKAGFPH